MSSRSSKKTTSEPTKPATAGDRVEVGRVLGPHGVRGEVAVESFSDVEDRFSPGAELLTAAGRPGLERLTIDSVRPHRGALLIRFAGVADRDAADALRGAVLEVPREAVPAPPEGTWYHFQLEGCRCRDARLGDLGEVVAVIEDGGGVILVVEGAVEGGGRRLLVPFVRAFVREVDPEDGRIELDLPEGLIEACASKS
jgi:16S rRNA processing protein RimM